MQNFTRVHDLPYNPSTTQAGNHHNTQQGRPRVGDEEQRGEDEVSEVVRQRRRAACNSATAQREERVTTGRPPAPPVQQHGALEIQSSHPRGSCH